MLLNTQTQQPVIAETIVPTDIMRQSAFARFQY